MAKHRNIKLRGKIKFSQYFQEFKNGDRVAIVSESCLNPAFPERTQGKSGTIQGMRGSAYLVKINMGDEEQIHIIKPAHLVKLK